MTWLRLVSSVPSDSTAPSLSIFVRAALVVKRLDTLRLRPLRGGSNKPTVAPLGERDSDQRACSRTGTVSILLGEGNFRVLLMSVRHQRLVKGLHMKTLKISMKGPKTSGKTSVG
jgi:hypothetical protein